MPTSALLYGDLPAAGLLYSFRGLPAISEFDWHFTSSHSSSNNIATLIGADRLTSHRWFIQFRVITLRLAWFSLSHALPLCSTC